MPSPAPTSRPRRPRFCLRVASIVGAALAAGTLVAHPAAVQAGGVVQRVASSGQLVLVGLDGIPPLLNRTGQNLPEGLAILVAERVAGLLAEVTGRPVRLRFEAEPDLAATGRRVVSGTADLACGVPFSWEADMAADFSMPFGISGLRLLTPAGGLSGDAASLASARIAAVKGGLGESQLRGLQPKATVVPVNSLGEGVEAMAAGRADGVIGDTLLLAALAPDRSPALKLVPQEPYERYAVTCLLPENDSEFRHLVDLAIAQLLQRYIDGDSAERAAVDRWLGPGSAVNLPHSVLQDVFRTLMLSRESIRPVPANPAAPASSR